MKGIKYIHLKHKQFLNKNKISIENSCENVNKSILNFIEQQLASSTQTKQKKHRFIFFFHQEINLFNNKYFKLVFSFLFLFTVFIGFLSPFFFINKNKKNLLLNVSIQSTQGTPFLQVNQDPIHVTTHNNEQVELSLSINKTNNPNHLYQKKIIVIAPNSEFILNLKKEKISKVKNIQKNKFIYTANILKGKVLFSMTRLHPTEIFQVFTSQSKINVKGTSFSVSVSKNNNTIKVYEGKVLLSTREVENKNVHVPKYKTSQILETMQVGIIKVMPRNHLQLSLSKINSIDSIFQKILSVNKKYSLSSLTKKKVISNKKLKNDAIINNKQIMGIFSNEVKFKPVYYKNHIIVLSTDNELLNIEQRKKSFKKVWKLNIKNNIINSPFVKENFIYLSDNSGYLHCIELNTGNYKYKKYIGIVSQLDMVSLYTLMYDRVLVLTSHSNKIALVKASNGRVIWSKVLLSGIYSKPLIVHYSSLIVASENNSIYSLDIIDGSIQWKFNTKKRIVYSDPVYDHYLRNRIYIGSTDHYLYSLDSLTGKLIFKKRVDAAIILGPFISKDTIVVGTSKNHLVAFDKRGKILYKKKLPLHRKNFHIQKNRFLLVNNNTLYIYDIKTGYELTRLSLPGNIKGNFSINKNKVLIGIEDGRLFSAHIQ